MNDCKKVTLNDLDNGHDFDEDPLYLDLVTQFVEDQIGCKQVHREVYVFPWPCPG